MNRGHVRRRCPKPLGSTCESKRCSHAYEWRFSHDARVVTGSAATERAATAAMRVAMAKAAAGELITRREQRAAEDEARIENQRQAVEAERRIRTGAYFTGWLAHRGNIRSSTRLGYSVIISRHVVPIIGDIPLADLTSADIRAVLERMADPDVDGKTRTVGTLSRVRSLLTGALKAAVRQGLVPVNVATGVEIPERASLGHASGRKPTFTAEDLRTFLAEADKTPFGPVLRFISRTGVRRGEAVGLRWEDVDLDEGVAQIRWSLTVTQGRADVNKPKTESGERFVGLDAATVALLRDLRRTHAEQALVLGGRDLYNPQGYVFTRRDGSHLRPDSISQVTRRITTAMGRPDLHVHSLRHTRGSMFLEAGTDIKIVADQLGHSDVAFTQRTYQHVSVKLAKQAARDAAAVLDALATDSVAKPVASAEGER